MGIWGPVSLTYLEEVHAGVLQALREAFARARPATLTWGENDASFIDNVILGEANSNEGWPVDGSMPVLSARDARSGATIATYVNVPVHANIVYGPGDGGLLSADYPGVAERYLEAHVGGTALVAEGTLGDQTSTMQVSSPGWFEINHVGTLVGNLALEALGQGHAITSTTLSAAQQYVTIPVTNPVLISIIAGKGQVGQQALGVTPADRSDQAPYWLGANVAGTWVSAFHIGPLAYVSEPGEAFPEVHSAIESGITGVDRVFVVGMAQDQLGYYFPSWAYPFTFYYSVDHYLYNVSPAAADQLVSGSRVALLKVGLVNSPISPMLPGQYQYLRTARPAVQDMAFPRSGAAPFRTEAQCFIDPARLQSNLDQQTTQIPANPAGNPAVIPTKVSSCTLNFGDGSPSTDGTYNSSHPAQVDPVHTWTKPGTYSLTAAVTDANGQSTSWSTPITVTPSLQAASASEPGPRGHTVYRAGAIGGDGVLLAAHWTLSDGSEAWGTTLSVARGGPTPTSVTVTDGDGSQATRAVSA
jgi:hypothetical protein